MYEIKHFVETNKNKGDKMSELYDKIDILCTEKQISKGKLCNDLGLHRSMLSDLKMGRKSTLSLETVLKIADYFGVTVDYLTGFDKIREAAMDKSHDGENGPLPGLVDGDKMEEVARREDIDKLTREMLDAFNRLTDEQKDLVLRQLKGILHEPDTSSK